MSASETAVNASDASIAKLQLEKEKLQLEKEKLALRTQRLLFWSAVIGLVTVAATTGWSIVTKASTAARSSPVPLFGNPPLAVFLHGAQAIMIFLFVRKHRQWLRNIKNALDEKAPDSPIAVKTLNQFTVGWQYMWYGWLLLYGWFTIAALIAPLGKLAWVESVSDVLDVVSGFAIWWCYLALDVRSVNIPTDRDRDRPFRRAVWVLTAGAIICIGFAVVDRVFHLGYFGVVLVGIFNALGLASFTGRLGSHYIGTPRWCLCLLYVYAMLQIFYSLLPIMDTKLWIPAVYISALLLKVVLAFAGKNMMQNGGLIRYLEAAESGLLEARGLDDAKWTAVMKAASTPGHLHLVGSED